jgi:hypothetical protein
MLEHRAPPAEVPPAVPLVEELLEEPLELHAATPSTSTVPTTMARNL